MLYKKQGKSGLKKFPKTQYVQEVAGTITEIIYKSDTYLR